VLVDSHCHLADEAFVADLPDVVARARAAGVEAALCILTAGDEAELSRAGAVRAAWAGVRFAAAVHPHKAGEYASEPAEAVRLTSDALDRMQAVAVGEIGLDYHYDFSPRDVQRAVFAGQVALAVERDLPMVIHTRLASDDTLSVLREAGHGRARGVMHCFTGTTAEASAALDAGFYISLAGILTFPRAAELRETARHVPTDRLLIETDAPYLAPVPHRGKRNEPAWVGRTLDALAALRGVTPEELGRTLTTNFHALFDDLGGRFR
jgi:TatD DNase family protein